MGGYKGSMWYILQYIFMALEGPSVGVVFKLNVPHCSMQRFLMWPPSGYHNKIRTI